MVKYQNVYDWKIYDEVMSGEKVYCLDKAVGDDYPVSVVNDLTMAEFSNLLDSVKDEKSEKSNRFEFWKVVEIEESEGE